MRSWVSRVLVVMFVTALAVAEGAFGHPRLGLEACRVVQAKRQSRAIKASCAASDLAHT